MSNELSPSKSKDSDPDMNEALRRVQEAKKPALSSTHNANTCAGLGRRTNPEARELKDGSPDTWSNKRR